MTKRDIKNGHIGEPESCPVARAMRRHKILAEAMVHAGYCEIKGVVQYAEISLPAKASRFIERFDKCEGVRPFEFTLKIP